MRLFGCVEVLPLLLQHDDGLGTTPGMVLRAVTNPEVTKILLEQKPLNQAAADIVESMSERVTPVGLDGWGSANSG